MDRQVTVLMSRLARCATIGKSAGKQAMLRVIVNSPAVAAHVSADLWCWSNASTSSVLTKTARRTSTRVTPPRHMHVTNTNGTKYPTCRHKHSMTIGYIRRKRVSDISFHRVGGKIVINLCRFWRNVKKRWSSLRELQEKDKTLKKVRAWIEPAVDHRSFSRGAL